MECVSSVTAFLCRYLGDPDAEAQEILNALTGAERRIIEILMTEPNSDARLRRLSEETGAIWSTARYERVVNLVLNRLRQLLQVRQRLQP
jgi:hypothetical protein